MHIALATLIFMNLCLIARITQFKHPFIIRWTYINSLSYKADYFYPQKMKYLFSVMLIYNIFCLSFVDNHIEYILSLWFIFVWWWDFFTTGKFKLCTCISTIDLLGYSFLSHYLSFFFIPNVVYFVYITYLSIFYTIESA